MLSYVVSYVIYTEMDVLRLFLVFLLQTADIQMYK